jgi:hypothetical protein
MRMFSESEPKTPTVLRNPREMLDDAETAYRVAEATLAARALAIAYRSSSTLLPTTIATTGLPIAFAFVLRHLVEVLHAIDPRSMVVTADGTARIIHSSDQRFLILLPNLTKRRQTISVPKSLALAARNALGVRLDTGADVRATVQNGSGELTIQKTGVLCTMPVMISISGKPEEIAKKNRRARNAAS